jgi:hypothetical protein
MFGRVAGIETDVAAVAAAFDPDAVDAASVVPLFEALDRIERCASTMKTLLARRVDDVQQWKRSGYKSAAEYVAAKSGSTIAAAKDSLATSAKVAELPVVEDAMRQGKLSSVQATLVADAAAAAPSQQSRLVNEAQRSSVAELKRECLRTKAAADPDRDATYGRFRAGRFVRTHTDAEGAWNLHARGPADAGARIEAALRPLIDEEFARARANGRHEERDAYAFDALAHLADTPADGETTAKPKLRNLMLIRVDLDALTRGDVEDDELCEITGIGPIPASVARNLLGESILQLVITKGVDVLNVTHLGRQPTAAQRIALLCQQLLCTAEGCMRTRTEIDYRHDWARTKHTRVHECDPLCKHHHDLKTYLGWMLTEGTGKRPMVPPDDPRHSNRKPPPS